MEQKVLLKELYKGEIQRTTEFNVVKEIAMELHRFLNQPKIVTKILDTHKVNAKSGEIQAILLQKALELGFDSERKGLFKKYLLRPDYYKRLSESSGILMEVERGKTLPNNMDLLDMWKCHICKEANYLFLIVPKFRQTEKGTQTDTFNKVVDRISSFFQEDDYINVDGVFVFGY